LGVRREEPELVRDSDVPPTQVPESLIWQIGQTGYCGEIINQALALRQFTKICTRQRHLEHSSDTGKCNQWGGWITNGTNIRILRMLFR
jgi:hypothetical protein